MKEYLIIRNKLQQMGYEVYKFTLPNQRSRVEVYEKGALVFQCSTCISAFDAAMKLSQWLDSKEGQNGR